ncbi:unnamed protein product [Auanema sp. JU1783]|nr:unnamed protein product [Auanema sp. JU1783]
MLRKLVCSLPRSRTGWRGLASGSDGKGPKDPNAKEVLGDDILNAVNDIANELHSTNPAAKKEVKNTLISKLIATEKSTFHDATAAQTIDMLEDSAVVNLLSDVAADAQAQRVAKPTAAQIRQDKRGFVLLRKEIFYQAIQSGYKAEEARTIAEKAVTQAQERVLAQRQAQRDGANAVLEEEAEATGNQSEKEKKLFEQAYQLAEKMLYQDDLFDNNGVKRKIVREDPSLPSLLSSSERLGIWSTLEGTQDRTLSFWTEWDKNAARTMNKSLGPENDFEQQIEWTTSGKQWQYPIDNEFKLGAEANVPFVEHIFLERHLKTLGIPNKGPVAHFMHLVCVGLSKNPYMTAEKKIEHLKWFANYFSKEKQELVHKLHEQEQIAAQNA